MERVCAIIASAGSGRRMGSAEKKQYILLRGRPIISYTLDVFEASPRVDGVVLVVPPGEVEICRGIVETFGFKKVEAIVEGGKERQDSVRKGLEMVEGYGLVLIHDGVRPFVELRMIEEVIEAASKWGAAITGIPVRDTVKRVTQEGMVEETIDREGLWLVQTPQAFKRDLIEEAHRRALEEGVYCTDDGALVERLGMPVVVVAGSWRNIKITTKDDLGLAEAILTSYR